MSKLLDGIQAMIEGRQPHPPVARLVGFRILEVADGRSRLTLDVDERHANPMGTMHGGIVCDLADAAMGLAYASLLGDDESFTTLELKANFLRPVWRASLVARGRVIKAGKSIGVVEATVEDESGNLVAHVTSTCMTLREGQAKGR